MLTGTAPGVTNRPIRPVAETVTVSGRIATAFARDGADAVAKGGRAVAALHPALWLVGLLGLGALVVVRPNPILIIILVFAVMELWRRWQTRDHPESRAYYRVLPWQRVAVAVTYFGLAVLLVLGMHETHVPRNF